MEELRMEIANARVSEQQTDKVFVLLNRELKLETEDSLPRNRRSFPCTFRFLYPFERNA